MQTTLSALLSASLLLALLSGCKPLNSSAGTTQVTYVQVGLVRSPYNHFLANWNEGKSPTFFAWIQSPEQYGQVFHPSPVQGDNRKFGPEPTVFLKEGVLVVSKVVPASKTGSSAFQVESLTVKDGELELRYRFTAGATGASYTIKDGLALQLPKGPYSKVRFIENQTEVGTLAVSQGQWSSEGGSPGR